MVDVALFFYTPNCCLGDGSFVILGAGQTMDSIQLIQVPPRQHTTPPSQTGAMTKKQSIAFFIAPLYSILLDIRK